MPVLNMACTGRVHVHSGYVVKNEMKKFSNYIWLEKKDSLAKQPGDNAMFNIELQASIDHQLKSIGFVNNNSQPCLIVHYDLVLRDDAIIRPLEGRNGNPYWLGDPIETYRYLKGTLIIDLVDSESGDIVWWGVAREVIYESSDELTSEQIETIVRKIFRRFPGRRKRAS